MSKLRNPNFKALFESLRAPQSLERQMSNSLVFGFLILFGIWILAFGFFTAADAAGLPQIVPQCRDLPQGCSVCDAFQVVQNIVNLSLGVLGSIALLLFAWGGLILIQSRGFSEKVQKGKDIIINATKGIVVVLGAWVLINLIVATFITGQVDLSKTGEVFGKKWSEVCVGITTSKTTTIGGGIDCADENNNLKDCGDNSVCFKEQCVPKCLQVNEANAAWQCRPLSQCANYFIGATYQDCDPTGSVTGCEKGLCPGAIQTPEQNTVVCCM